MRRPPEVGLVLLSLLASLPAVSGCAGVTQRLNLSAPVLSGSDGAGQRTQPTGMVARISRRLEHRVHTSRLGNRGSSPSRPAWAARRMCGRSRRRSGWPAVSRCSAGPGTETPPESQREGADRPRTQT